ncbi:Reverse transcriptase domain-containing protein [Aphis craccivora]|uniref:Reverse transcriptase domain-containing protein n=1 Tax=Aphis craccivora TaxID=307492 RepID=A0A6G0YN67_APHCR|nr:Reverse transcriptase domain-containing protein [Aphis craccivora]
MKTVCPLYKKIIKQLNITATVSEANRITLSDNKNPIRVAKLDTIDMRRDLISAYKAKKLNVNMLSSSWTTESKIFINERLTKKKRFFI